jgi:uncharacterized protein
MVFDTLRNSDEKFERLCQKIESYGKMVVAFSGGVDSTFLIKVATLLVGDSAIALTVRSPYIANWEIMEAMELSKQHHFSHHFIEVGIPSVIADNPIDRCYLCKGKIFSTIKAYAAEQGIQVVADGTNVDDTKDYRPGMKALSELEIQSPLMECEITKDEIRAWSKELGLETWDKPPYACLLTRLPYGTTIDVNDLRMIEASEAYLIKKGIRAVRVRKQGGLARIEIERNELHKIFDLTVMSDIATHLKGLGFEQVTLDMEGYVMGSFNKDVVKA